MAEKMDFHKHADKDGQFRRKDARFRNFIQADPSSDFPAEKGRYALYINLGCPWAHRANLVAQLKGLDKDIIQIIYTDFDLTKEGWLFSDRPGSRSTAKDPL